MTVLRALVLGAAVVTLAALTGCGGGSGSNFYQSVSERGSWSTSETLAFTAFGGNGLKYVWRCNVEGGSQLTLTVPSSLIDATNEGGFNPVYRPGVSSVVFSGRRSGGSVSLFSMDSLDGDRKALTALTDGAVAGQDIQANYSADGARVIFASDKATGGGTGSLDIAIMNADGSGRAYETSSTLPEQWPCFSPDGARIAFTRGLVAGPTDIIVRDTASDVETNLTEGLRPAPGGIQRYEAPAWVSIAGVEWIYFHSNRAGDFDIWRVQPDGSNLQQITNDSRSDGYPVISPAGTRLLLTRDRELWSRDPAPGTVTETRVTKRF